MLTETVAVDPRDPAAAVVARAADVLRRGGLVAFPTETVYGLGANALDAAAVAGIFLAKGRPAKNPVIVHVADLDAARKLAAAWPDAADRLAQRFWPGPLSLVLPKRPEIPEVVTAGGPTVAIRIPAHPVALALIRAAGVPIAAPSANRSTELSPTRAEHVLRGLDGRIDMLLDGGPTPGGIESTVLDVTITPPRLLRPGLVGIAEMEAVVGTIDRTPPTDALLASPGMMARHYAPQTPTECSTRGADRVRELAAAGVRVGWLAMTTNPVEIPGVVTLALPPEPSAYAADLYAALHTLDAGRLDRMVIDLPPKTDAWLAVLDRLGRASPRRNAHDRG